MVHQTRPHRTTARRVPAQEGLRSAKASSKIIWTIQVIGNLNRYCKESGANEELLALIIVRLYYYLEFARRLGLKDANWVRQRIYLTTLVISFEQGQLAATTEARDIHHNQRTVWQWSSHWGMAQSIRRCHWASGVSICVARCFEVDSGFNRSQEQIWAQKARSSTALQIGQKLRRGCTWR